ncbi:monocyte chemotactic protein 1B-like [Colossoma macropomum]|uniref:monocyte chemotactic protein 1B-like n=1 Tax=Colossoma macropomum TaxID=42526 RepID=UPI001864480D|nr:monocyte chemotactic protein 1B-like [Colossoma macropomum]
MRTLSALLMVLLLCSLQQVCSGTFGTETFRECCEKLTHLKIPLRRIKSYGETSSNCPFKAVIFRTDKGKQWCVDPEASWVQKHLMELKPRS